MTSGNLSRVSFQQVVLGLKVHQALPVKLVPRALQDQVAREEEKEQGACLVPKESGASEDYLDPPENQHQIKQSMLREIN